MKYNQLIYASFIFLLVACKGKHETTFPAKQDIVQAVYASGKVFPLNSYKVFTRVPGLIQNIHVRVNDSVSKGQALLTLQSEVSEKNEEAARNIYEQALRNASEQSPVLLARLKEVESAKSKFKLDSLNLVRYKNLDAEQAVSKIQFDQAKTQFEISEQTYIKARASYAALKEQLNTELENARLQLEAQTSNHNDFTISSVLSGRVYDILPKVGELVGNQMLLMEIGKSDSFEVELSIDETDVGLIEIGQEVVFTIDAYQDHIYPGKVKEIFARINPVNKTGRVLATIQLPTNIKIFSGMSVEANIIIQKKSECLVIPREYLLNNNSVISSSGDTIKIQKGAEDLEFIEVFGLEESTELVKP